MAQQRSLRIITYLAPSIPQRFYQAIAEHLGERLGARAKLVVEERVSGPSLQDDPFEVNNADVGFMCAPSLVLLRKSRQPSIELLPLAPVFTDERAAGKPLYFSDVVVHRDSGITHFEQLRGRTWAYNDARSLSGWHCALERLRTMRSESEFFSSTVASGSHHESLRLVNEGLVDAAAIDSTVLAIKRHLRPSPAGRFRIIESWGPWPVHPVVVRASLEEAAKATIIEALAELHRTKAMDAMSGIPFERFASVTYEDYTAAPAVVEAARMMGAGEHH